MRIDQLRLGLATLLLGVASAASSYKVTLPSDLSAGNTLLKAGDYRVSLEGKQAVFKRGRESIQVPAVVDKNPKKFSGTRLETAGSTLQAIDVGGTDMIIRLLASH